MGDLGKDIRHALQMFMKSPGFTIAAVAALALGIGANTAIFTVVNAVLLKPLTYPDADRIVAIEMTGQGGKADIASITKFHVYQHQTSIFKDVAAYDFAGPGFNITGDRPELVHGIHVTEAYFRVFGAPVILGRTFTPQEDLPNGRQGCSAELWTVAAAVRRKSALSGEPYTICRSNGEGFRNGPGGGAVVAVSV